MSYAQVFGGATLYASQQTYLSITFAVDVQLTWPVEQQIAGTDVVADIMDLNATAVSLNVDMPDARQVSNGVQSVFTNQGANTLTLRDNVGGTIISIAPGEAWVAYLTDNSTQAGSWRTFQLGATVSVANASALAGAGLKAIATTLNQRIEVDTTAVTPVNAVDADRAQLTNYLGGVGILNLPDPGVVGSDWFFFFRNSGSGDMTATPAAGSINQAATIDFSPGESAIIVTDGTDYFTIGFGTAASGGGFDFIAIAVPGTGDFTLSGAQLNRISYRFTGILTGARKIVVPNTVQEYWVDNQTTGAFALTVGTAAGASPEVPQGDRAILYSDGTDVVNATTSSITFPITIAQGGTSAITAGAALVNLGAVPTTRVLNDGFGISPTGLGDLSADRTINALVPSETQSGAAEIATQAEVDAAADDIRYVTPLKLAAATSLGRTDIRRKILTTTRTTDATSTNDPELLGWVLAANQTYVIEGLLFPNVQAGGITPGLRCRWGFTGTFDSESRFGYINDASSGSAEMNQAAPGTDALFDMSVTQSALYIRGLINTINAGTLDFQWGQGGSSANFTALVNGSWISIVSTGLGSAGVSGTYLS